MRIIFVRHGDPNYEKDCLTERGREQAASVAERLKRENISEIYASSMGRAKETASYTAKVLGLPVTLLDFMREISWGGAKELLFEGHPWDLSDYLIDHDNCDFSNTNWREHPYFKENIASQYYDRVTASFDELLQKYGFRKEGTHFYCTGECEPDKTIAVFSHGGSGGCVLAYLLSLPLPYVFSVMPYGHTSIIILEFPDQKGKYVHPRLALFNDMSHVAGGSAKPAIQKKVDK